MTNRDRQTELEIAMDFLRLARTDLIRGREDSAQVHIIRAQERIQNVLRPSPEECLEGKKSFENSLSVSQYLNLRRAKAV